MRRHPEIHPVISTSTNGMNQRHDTGMGHDVQPNIAQNVAPNKELPGNIYIC